MAQTLEKFSLLTHGENLRKRLFGFQSFDLLPKL